MKHVKQIVIGALVADFVTAAAHWLEDTYLPYTKAQGLLGSIARDNEMHHFIPFSITTGSWWDNCRVSWMLLAVIGMASWVIAPRWCASHRTFLITTAALMGITNLLHRFQHERDCARPRIVTMLQKTGILCSRDEHAVHHRQPSIKYGVLWGFSNTLYDTLGVWRLLEGMIHVMTGVSPHQSRKPGVQHYVALYDEWLQTNLARDCPEPLSSNRLARYHMLLDNAHDAGLI